MGCRTRELREKSVVSVCDGRCLGNICDFEIDPCTGKIEAIFVPGYNGGFWSKTDDIRISWDCINRIGEDTILVNIEVSENECNCCKDGFSHKKHRWFW